MDRQGKRIATPVCALVRNDKGESLVRNDKGESLVRNDKGESLVRDDKGDWFAMTG